MKSRAFSLGLALLAVSALAHASGPDPRERNFKLFVDGAEVDGVVGYRISFARVPVPRSDSRRLDRAYAPDERRLVLTLTEKGLSRLQDWLNDATDDGTPAGKNVTIIARDNENQLLAKWDFTGVSPVTFSSAAAGNVNQVDSTVEFAFERMRLVEARAR
ncbi:MAG TPA: hypothetical protein VFW15_07200 [Thermoanaerobaculia bacterium]|nr:hypothetical protein [Thermoanaerobaculia bacterium]